MRNSDGRRRKKASDVMKCFVDKIVQIEVTTIGAPPPAFTRNVGSVMATCSHVGSLIMLKLWFFNQS